MIITFSTLLYIVNHPNRSIVDATFLTSPVVSLHTILRLKLRAVTDEILFFLQNLDFFLLIYSGSRPPPRVLDAPLNPEVFYGVLPNTTDQYLDSIVPPFPAQFQYLGTLFSSWLTSSSL